MIKGSRKKTLITKDAILEKVSTYDIYRFYQGPFKLDEVCVNKHRGEKDPSLIIGTKLSGELTHKDFGDYSWRGDAFHFVMQIFRCDFPTALCHINRDLNLGLDGGRVVEKKIITWEKPEIEIRTPPLLQVLYYSKMTKEALDYWKKFDQGEDDLKRERVYQLKEIWRNRRKVADAGLLQFGYHYEDIDKWKIYRPFAPKKDTKTPIGKWKWDSNVPFDYADNIQSITPECSKAFVTKSKKDRMVLMKALQTDCMADFQAEDPACVTVQAIERYEAVKSRFVIADNDKKGKEFSWWLTKQHGFRHVNVPDMYLTGDPKCTDFADLCYHYGIQEVINHFKSKNICA